MQKKVLVTGATGFLGRHLVSELVKENYDVVSSNSKTANLTEYTNLYQYNDLKFDYIFHLAAFTKAGDWCLYHPAEQFEINQKINTNILKYWKEHQPQAKMIAMGTSCSYSPEYPLSEDYYLKGNPESSLFTYAMTKRMLLTGLQAYSKQYGLKYIQYIPSTLYGPLFDLEDSHFIFDLIKKIYNGKFNNTPVELWGDGYQSRELIYVTDAIKIMLSTLHLENSVLNLGRGKEYTIREYANTICNLLDYDTSSINYNTEKYVGVKSKQLSTEKLNQLLPNFVFTDLSVGLMDTVNYYVESRQR